MEFDDCWNNTIAQAACNLLALNLLNYRENISVKWETAYALSTKERSLLTKQELMHIRERVRELQDCLQEKRGKKLKQWIGGASPDRLDKTDHLMNELLRFDDLPEAEVQEEQAMDGHEISQNNKGNDKGLNNGRIMGRFVSENVVNLSRKLFRRMIFVSFHEA